MNDEHDNSKDDAAMLARLREPGRMARRLTIEFPSVGATYRHNRYGVYAYDTFPESSVLAGRERRVFIDDCASLAEAQKLYPVATYVGGSQYRETVIPETPPDWFDPEAAGERWEDDY